jgi:hypothetical protein
MASSRPGSRPESKATLRGVTLGSMCLVYFCTGSPSTYERGNGLQRRQAREHRYCMSEQSTGNHVVHQPERQHEIFTFARGALLKPRRSRRAERSDPTIALSRNSITMPSGNWHSGLDYLSSLDGSYRPARACTVGDKAYRILRPDMPE